MRTAAKQCLPDRTGLLNSWTYNSCHYLYNICSGAVQSKLQRGRGVQEASLWLKELLSVDGTWERKSQFSSGIWSLIGCPFSTGWAYLYICTYWQHWLDSLSWKKQAIKLGWDVVGGLGRVGEEICGGWIWSKYIVYMSVIFRGQIENILKVECIPWPHCDLLYILETRRWKK